MQLFYDTETTGLWNGKLPVGHADQPRIAQICAVLDYPDGREAMRLDVVICRENIPDKAASIHGITTAMSQKIGVSESAALDVFLNMVEVAEIVVGHNIQGYDNRIITNAARLVYEEPDFEPFKNKPIFDTQMAGTPLCKLTRANGGAKFPTLMELHRHLFKEDFESAHTAVSDVLASRRCFYRMQEILKGLNIGGGQ